MNAIIDAFCHVMPQRIYQHLARIVPGHPSIAAFRRLPELWDADRQLRLIDSYPGYRQIPSLANPPVETVAGRDESPALARMVNDELAEMVARHPNHFAGFVASMPMNNPDAACAEAIRSVRDLGACGIQMFTNVAGRPLSDGAYFEIFRTMSELDRPVWVHPMRAASFADYAGESISENEIWFTFGWPYETSACMTRLIFAGLFDKLPSIKIISHHMGGMIPYFSEKIGLGFSQIFAGRPDHNPAAAKAGLLRQPLDYFHMLFGDTALNGSIPATRCGHAFFTTPKCVFGTDAPFDAEGGHGLIRRTIAAVNVLEITDAERQAIFSGNITAMIGGHA
jgi:aminocarboxymuconate-semialdehyde decarboxylase